MQYQADGTDTIAPAILLFLQPAVTMAYFLVALYQASRRRLLWMLASDFSERVIAMHTRAPSETHMIVSLRLQPTDHTDTIET